jgi:hypothetical protein
VYNAMLVEFIHGGNDAIFQFLFGCDADVTNGAGEFREEAFDEMNSRLRWRSLTRGWAFPVRRSMPANRLTVPRRSYS